jgi:hypothetical protein
MFKFCFLLVLLVTFAAGLIFCGQSLNAQEPVRTTPGTAAKPQTIPKTVQLSLNGDADLLLENAEGKRVGLDFKSGKFVNEINARVVARESSATFILPFDKSGQTYKLTVSGKSASKAVADLTMAGPGFLIGFKDMPLTSGQLQQLTMASNGLHLSFTANQDGPTPQLFLTTQSGRGNPSYRFEISSSLLRMGKTISVALDTGKGRLLFKTDDPTKQSFALKIRRTNPGGNRDAYAHNEISFASSNSYAMDFGAWDGKSEMCFFEVCESCQDSPCTKLKNESR